MSFDYQIQDFSDNALIVQFRNLIDQKINAKVHQLFHYLQQYPIAPITEMVPAFATLTIFYDIQKLQTRFIENPREKLKMFIDNIITTLPPLADKQQASHNQTIIEIPVCYENNYAPDMPELMRHTGLSRQQIIHRHTHIYYYVYMLGFAPGFPYLGGLDSTLAIPRKSEPRLAIPAGSVGIADKQTGIYPLESPGGWQLIGRTPLNIFNINQTPPAYILPGNYIQFVPINSDQFEKMNQKGGIT